MITICVSRDEGDSFVRRMHEHGFESVEKTVDDGVEVSFSFGGIVSAEYILHLYPSEAFIGIVPKP